MLKLLSDRTPLYFMIQSFWRDEGFSYLMAKRGILDMIRATAHDFNPPLYYLILHFWMKIFGSSEVALRSLSLIFFAINIYIVFLFLQNILKVKGSRTWVYLLIFALNPFLLYYAFEARMYSLVALLTTVSFYYFFKKRQVNYVMFTILGLYTHYFFLLVIFTQIIYLTLFEKGKVFKKIKVFIAPLLIFLPWLFYVLPALVTRTTPFWMERVNLVDFFASLGILFTGYERIHTFYDPLIILISLFFIFMIGFFIFVINKRKNHLFYLLLLWSFFPYFLIFFISFFKPMFIPRYLIFAPVGFNLLLFYILEHVGKKARFLLIFIIVVIVFHYTSQEVIYKRKSDVRQTIVEIKKLATKNDYLFVSDKNAPSYFVAVYYFDENRVYLYKETSEITPFYIGLAILPENKITTKLPHYPRKAFVLNNDFQYRILSTL